MHSGCNAFGLVHRAETIETGGHLLCVIPKILGAHTKLCFAYLVGPHILSRIPPGISRYWFPPGAGLAACRVLQPAPSLVATFTQPPQAIEGERHLVGAWRYRWDGTARDLGLEYEFLPDRTCRVRNYHPATGKLVSEATATWGLSGDTLTVRHPEAKTRSLSRLLPSQRAMVEESALAPDGPDRFRYRGAVDGGPPVTGTMARVRRPD